MGAEHADALACERSLVRLRLAEGRSEDALRMVERNVAGTRSAHDPLGLGDALLLYGEALQAVGRPAESESVLTEALTLLEPALPDTHPDLVQTRDLLASARSGDRP